MSKPLPTTPETSTFDPRITFEALESLTKVWERNPKAAAARETLTDLATPAAEAGDWTTAAFWRLCATRIPGDNGEQLFGLYVSYQAVFDLASTATRKIEEEAVPPIYRILDAQDRHARGESDEQIRQRIALELASETEVLNSLNASHGEGPQTPTRVASGIAKAIRDLDVTNPDAALTIRGAVASATSIDLDPIMPGLRPVQSDYLASLFSQVQRQVGLSTGTDNGTPEQTP